MAKAPRIPPAAWARHEAKIRELYPKMSLRELMQTMVTDHQFEPSSNQYVRQLKKWEIMKTTTKDQWRGILTQKQGLSEEHGQVVVRDKPLSDRKLKKVARRYGWSKQDLQHTGEQTTQENTAETDESPAQPTLQTPQQHQPQDAALSRLPCCQFQNLIKQLSTKEDPCEPPIMGSSFDISNSLSSLGHRINDFMDFNRIDFPIINTSHPELSMGLPLAGSLVASDRSLSELKKLHGLLNDCLNECFPHDEGDSYSDTVCSLHLRVPGVFVRKDRGSVSWQVTQTSDTAYIESIFWLFGQFAYLVSNNLLDNSQIELLLEWILDNDKLWIVKLFLEKHLISAEAFVSALLFQAADMRVYWVVMALICKWICADESQHTILAIARYAEAQVNVSIFEVLLTLYEIGCLVGTKETNENRRNDSSDDKSCHEKCRRISKMIVDGMIDTVMNCPFSNISSLWLFRAVIESKFILTRRLLLAGANPGNYLGMDNSSLLTQAAVVSGDADILGHLLLCGANAIDPADVSSDYNPEHALLEDLIEDAIDWDLFLTPLHIAISMGRLEICAALLQAGAYDSILEKPLRSCNERGLFFEARGNQGWPQSHSKRHETAFEAAVFSDRPVLAAKLLLDHRADIHGSFNRGTYLQIAARAGASEVVQELLARGAKVNAPRDDELQWTVLQEAAFSGSEATVTTLIEKGADVNAEAASKYGMTALQAAYRYGSLSMVKILVVAGANVSTVSGSGVTPFLHCLQAAVAGGRDETFEYLLLTGPACNPSLPTSWMTAQELEAVLVSAVDGKHSQLVERLLELGTQICGFVPQHTLYQVLEHAIKTGQPDIVETLLRHNARADGCLCISSSGDLKSPLKTAMMQGSIVIVDMLIKAGANVNGPFTRYVTPFRFMMNHGLPGDDILSPLLLAGMILRGNAMFAALELAASRGWADAVRLLFLQGLCLDPTGDYVSSGGSALHKAVDKDHFDPDMIDLLLDHGANAQDGVALQFATRFRNVSAVQRLIRAGANVNASPNHSLNAKAALEWAVHHQDVRLVNILLAAGATVETLSSYESFNAIILQESVEGQNLDLVKLLLTLGAEVNDLLGDAFSQSALRIAVAKENMAIVLELLKYGADVNAVPCWDPEQTALHVAVAKKNMAIVLELLKYGADVNAPSRRDSQKTALQIAVAEGNIAIVSELLKHGADVNASPCGDPEQTALQIAVANGNMAIASELLKYGADVNSPPALPNAAAKGYLPMAVLLLQHGAKVNSYSRQSRGRVLDVAAFRGRLDMACLMLLQDGEDRHEEFGRERAAARAAREGHVVLARAIREWENPRISSRC